MNDNLQQVVAVIFDGFNKTPVPQKIPHSRVESKYFACFNSPPFTCKHVAQDTLQHSLFQWIVFPDVILVKLTLPLPRSLLTPFRRIKQLTLITHKGRPSLPFLHACVCRAFFTHVHIKSNRTTDICGV